MKKFFLFMLSLGMIGCSVDRDEQELNSGDVREINAVVEITGCNVMTENFGNAGKVEVINNDDHLFITFVASEGYSLIDAKLHLANSFSEFPVVGQGNLPPGQMEYHESFDTSLAYYTFSFPLSELGSSVLIAAKGTFTNGNEELSSWAGDNLQKGNWSYFEYYIQTCTIDECSEGFAGADNSLTLSLAEFEPYATSVSRVRTLFLGRILESGVSVHGSFDPTITQLAERYMAAEDKTGTYSTTYTVIEGDCSDSAELSLILTP